MKDISHDDVMADVFRDDPDYAAALLNSVFEDGEQGELLAVLRIMTKAFGGMQAVAEQAELNPTQLYRVLSKKGNPTLSTLRAILHTMGLRVAVLPIVDSAKPAPKRAKALVSLGR